ncbi:hypothetical protein ABT317_16785, partial [Streptomyces carpinensis]
MTDRPYEGSPYDGSYEGSRENPYQGYDPYAQQPQPYAQPQPHQHPQAHQAQPPQAQQHQQPQGWPGQQQGYDDPHAGRQYTQQWQGQTWDTQTHAQPLVAAAEPAAQTAYLPSMGHHEPAPAPASDPYGAQAPAPSATAAPAAHAGA